MTTMKMQEVAKPAEGERTVIVLKHQGHGIVGVGEFTYLCGGCEHEILKDVEYKQVQNIVFCCGRCGAYSEIPASHHTN